MPFRYFQIKAVITAILAVSSAPVTTVAEPSPTFQMSPDLDKLPPSERGAWCRRPEVIKNILIGLNATSAIRNSGEKIFDFKNATTTKFEPTKNILACHGIAQVSNGQALPGTFFVEMNSAGESIWRWMNDDQAPQNQLAEMSDMPDDQLAFVEAVGLGGQAYENAGTDFARGASRPSRAALVCAALKSRNAKNWIGKLTGLTTNSEGKGVITIELIRGLIYAKTWNNSLSDIGADTLVEPASRLFNSLGKLNISERVKFSGEFLSSKVDCVKEASMSLQGSMTQPEYLMRFSTVEKK
jgi:hypothetical protein